MGRRLLCKAGTPDFLTLKQFYGRKRYHYLRIEISSSVANLYYIFYYFDSIKITIGAMDMEPKAPMEKDHGATWLAPIGAHCHI